MLKRIKILALPLLLAAILALSLPGCGGTGEEELTQQELEQVMADSMLAVKDATSYAFTLDMDVNAEAVGGSQAGSMGLTMRSDGIADIVAKHTQMDMDMDLEQDIPGGDSGSQSVSAEIYMMTDWMYMKMNIEGVGEQWVKTPVTEEVKDSYNLNMVDQQLGLLGGLGEIKFLKYESVDGSQCYVLEFIPDIASMKKWLNEQSMTSGTAEWNDLMEDMFNELSCTVWVARDTNLIKKFNMVIDMDMSAEQAGANETDFDTMTLHMEIEMTMSDYNEPVNINLPDEAEDAVEM
jgi:hypothetical protein